MAVVRVVMVEQLDLQVVLVVVLEHHRQINQLAVLQLNQEV